MSTIAILGGGKIGEALISGLIAAGREPKTIVATNRTAERSAYLRDTYGIQTSNDNAQAVDSADIVFLCLKPKQIIDLLAEISPALEDGENFPLLVSMAAGITVAAMEDAVIAGTPIIRVMPNTPMLVGKGMNALSRGRYVEDDQVQQVVELLETVGEVVEVAESDMDAVTALSGSAPAYYFLFTEALIDAGVSLGLPRAVAEKLAHSSARGAGEMLVASGKSASDLRVDVSSPAGTTVAALRTLEAAGLRTAVMNAAEACATRSKELGD